MSGNRQNFLSCCPFFMFCLFVFVLAPFSSAWTQEKVATIQEVKLVWAASNYGHGEQIYFSSYEKKGWTAPVQLSDTADRVFQPACSSGTDGKIWVVWSSQGENGSYLQFAVHDGTQWTNPARIDTGMKNNKAATIVVDQKNVPWIAVTATVDKYPDVYWFKWNGKSWGAPVRIHDTNAVPDVQPTLFLDKDRKIYLSWQTFDAGQYVTKCMSWDGGKWQPVSDAVAQTTRKQLVQHDKDMFPSPEFVDDPRKAAIFFRKNTAVGSVPLTTF